MEKESTTIKQYQRPLPILFNDNQQGTDKIFIFKPIIVDN